MIKLVDILKEISLHEKWWAILVDSPEDWEILSQFLFNKGYKFEPGHSFSGKDLSTFNPLKDELIASDGTKFKLEPPKPAPEVPEEGFVISLRLN